MIIIRKSLTNIMRIVSAGRHQAARRRGDSAPINKGLRS